jgi:ankyrin repeat protein
MGTRHYVNILAAFLCLASVTACAKITPLHQAAGRGDAKQTLALIDLGANVNERDIANQTPLHYAASTGQIDTVRALLDRGAEIDAKNINGTMPLHYAAAAGRMEVVRLLVERGADVRAKQKTSVVAAPESPAQVAERQGHPDVAQYLREAEARGAEDRPVTTPSSSLVTVPSKSSQPPPPPIY